MRRPIHFEIPAEDPQRAMKFYQTVFGWTFQKWDGPVPYWIIVTGPSDTAGINGGLMPRRDPAQPCVNTMDVENLDEMVQTVLAEGGQIAVPKMPIPGVGWLAYCKDTEGHIFGMMQADPAAKM
jgi:predicted enzyme related to lactoylglutathione lyase